MNTLKCAAILLMLAAGIVGCSKDDPADFCSLCREGKFDKTLPMINAIIDSLETVGFPDWNDRERIGMLVFEIQTKFPCIFEALIFGVSSNIVSEIDGVNNPYASEISIEFGKYSGIPKKILQISMKAPLRSIGYVEFDNPTGSNSDPDPAKAILGKWEIIAYGNYEDRLINGNWLPNEYLEFLPNGIRRQYSPYFADNRGFYWVRPYSIDKDFIVSHLIGLDFKIYDSECMKYSFFDEDKLKVETCVFVPPEPWMGPSVANIFIYQRKNN